MSNELVEAIANMQEDEAIELVNNMLDRGEDASHILSLCQEAMAIVGKRHEEGEYFLPELMMAGDMLKTISDLVKPRMLTQSEGPSRLGKVVLGTVRGDIHDIGKDIVGFMLDANGFEVHDLGVDVPEERFVQAVKEVQADVVALSGFLTLAFDTMKSTIDALSEAGLRDKVMIMVGGGQVNEMIRDFVGADASGRDAMAAVALAKQYAALKADTR